MNKQNIQQQIADLKKQLSELEQKVQKTEEQIETILEEFDFEKVQSVMNFLGWKWKKGTPTIDEMKDCVRGLYDSVKKGFDPTEPGSFYFSSTGGFRLTAYNREDGVEYELLFILEEWFA